LLLIVMMALSSVLAPFISQNCGAGNPARAKAALLLCMRFALLFQLGVYVLTWLLAPSSPICSAIIRKWCDSSCSICIWSPLATAFRAW
jgi:Na+-driven multidrug efflux pump